MYVFNGSNHKRVVVKDCRLNICRYIVWIDKFCQYLSIQPKYLQILRRQCCHSHFVPTADLKEWIEKQQQKKTESREGICCIWGLGKPPRKKSAVFLNIVQKAFGPPPFYLNICPILQGVFFMIYMIWYDMIWYDVIYMKYM